MGRGKLILRTIDFLSRSRTTKPNTNVHVSSFVVEYL